MKKFILTIFLFLICSTAHATTWFACTSGGNWSANVWTSISADQSTCAAALGTPVAGDIAILNSSSGNITITAAAAAAGLTMTGYTGTLAFGTFTLTMTGGTITLATGNTITATSGGLSVTGSETLVSAGQTWPVKITLAGTVTLLTNNWTTSGLTTVSSVILNNTTSETYTASGGLTNGGSSSSGTATMIISGGTWSGSKPTTFPITLAGNVTVSGTVQHGSSTLTYSSGTITTTGSTLQINGSETLNTNGITWGTIQIGSAGTITLTSALQATTLLIPAFNEVFAGAFNITTGTFTDYATIAANTTTFVAGQTLNVTSALNLDSNFSSAASLTILSGTGSSNTNINYSGSAANDNVYNVKFTDVAATGSTINNYNGNTLLRTTNITNVNASNLGGGSVGFFMGSGN